MQDVITNFEQVTPQWLTNVLHEKGYLSRSSGSVVQEIGYSQRSSTWFADISFLKIGYSSKVPESAPSQLVLKVSKPNLTSADLFYGKKEVEFYNALAKAMDDPPLVRCYDAVYAPDTGRSHLLLDDLSDTHFQPPSPLPPSGLYCELVVDCLAEFHTHWWEHPWLGTDIRNLFDRETSTLEKYGLPHSRRETEEMFPGFVDFLGDRLSVARCSVYEKVLSSWPFSGLSARIKEGRGVTLIHGDAHAWNFLYPHDTEHDRVRLIDWQEWCINLGTKDLTEMIVLWWYPERRARLEKSLVRRYHHRLIEHGIKGYDWEQCWKDYRLSAISILLYPVWMHASDRSPAYWWPVLERSMLAFQDLDCIELLE